MSQLPDDAWQTYKRLLSYVKPHALILFASVIGYAIYAATQAGAAQLAGYLGETVVNPEPHRVVIVSVAPFLIALAQGLGQFMGSYSMTWVAQEIVYRLRNDVFGHVLRLPASNAPHHSPAERHGRHPEDSGAIPSPPRRVAVR